MRHFQRVAMQPLVNTEMITEKQNAPMCDCLPINGRVFLAIPSANLFIKMTTQENYAAFLQSKIKIEKEQGHEIHASGINPILKPHQKAIVEWMVKGGRRACFASFGLGKSIIQLESVRITRDIAGGMGLIVIPLGVRQEFVRDSLEILKWEKPPLFIRRIEEATDPNGIYMTNYETIRDGKLDPAEFTVATLDEASVLRGFGGSKTFREFMRLFTGDGGPSRNHRQDGKTVQFRFVATATPSPNDYIELLAYADFLGIMDVSQAKTRFFKRDSTKADKLTLHAHKEEEFWLWVSSWALFVQRPSDLGYSDDGYDMPPLEVRWHEVTTDHSNAGYDKLGQGKLLKDAAIGIQDASREKRESLTKRVDKMLEIRNEFPEDHVLIWHDLEDERHAIQQSIPESKAVFGSQELELREQLIIDFSNGKYKELSTKPRIAGSGCNFQRHCHWSIFLGIGFKFNDFIQAIHRVQRFGQTKTVRVDIIFSEAERGVRQQLERKWQQHEKLTKKMSDIIKTFGLSAQAMAGTLARGMGMDRVEIQGEHYRIVNNDTVIETAALPDNSVDLEITSIPFSTQYEYSPNYADFGHSEGNDEFFKQMDFLTPHLLRVLKPGRLACIHVKDRIIPGGMTGLGFQTVYPFHMHTINHFLKHGFAYMGMKTIVTDVVRENAQTYRLGWTEQCKDGSKMGVGMPEYLLMFRKPQTDSTKGYADEPVIKSKERYSRARWQADAHGFTRSSGNRLLTKEDFEGLTHGEVFRKFKAWSETQIYSYENHVQIAGWCDEMNMLPTGFMLLQPQSWSEEVWSDVTRMMTLNSQQYSKGQEMHLCPLQFDIVDRCIKQFSNKGETVFDPFGGIMTVPYRAMKFKRKGIAFELNKSYFADGAGWCAAMEAEISIPDLFDLEQLDKDNGAKDYTADPKEIAELETATDELIDDNQPALI
jgi:DNA modification methylase